MVQQTINIGATANDGTGDALRSAFTKVNANDTELYAAVASNAAAIANKLDTLAVDPDGTLAADSDSKVASQKATKTALAGKADKTAVRELLAANRTYYVRTDGSDSNTGLVNSSAGAFLTIQKAIDTAAALDLGIYAVTIQAGAGTYTGALSAKRYVGAGPITIIGDTTTPSNCVLSVTGNSVFTGNGTPKYVLKGFKLQTTTSGNGIIAINGAVIDYESFEFGAVAAGYNHIFSGSNSVVTNTAGTTVISGSAANHMFTSSGGRIVSDSRAFTLSGTPAFSGAFATASMTGSISLILATFSGAATGKRYDVSLNAVVNASSASVGLPGDAAGTTATGGQYVGP